MVARYAMFMSSMIIAGKKKFFQNHRAKKERRRKFRVDLFSWIEKEEKFRGDKLSRISQFFGKSEN